ncbi:MAG: DUF885 domain-containing protein [Flavobacteriales bacterium]
MRSTLLSIILLLVACTPVETPAQKVPVDFDGFKTRFLDAYWKQFPSAAISVGYGKYYDELPAPDSAYFVSSAAFAERWLDSLHAIGSGQLPLPERISYRMMENELRRSIWAIDTLQDQRWDASRYNIGGDVYAILTQDYAPLDARLRDLSAHLSSAGDYYAAALNVLKNPTKEHVQLAIGQNKGALTVFGQDLTDSIAKSTLPETDRQMLNQRVEGAKAAINGYIAGLTNLLSDSTVAFRDFRLSQALYEQKFKYEIVSDMGPVQIFQLANAQKDTCHREMYRLSKELWPKYLANSPEPADSLVLIKTMIDRLSLQHVQPAGLFDTINAQLHRINRFILAKDLFNFDTAASVKVRLMPPFSSGVTMASAEFPLPYQMTSSAYYNVADLSGKPADEVESALREYNHWMLQLLTIHEAVPGHCMQGIYTQREAPDKVKAVFANGAMVEGWAVYSERMMMENGWDDNAPEMWLMYYKWNLRECTNVLVDYGIHRLGWSEKDIRDLLVDQAFQEEAQVREKYRRATLSQVQLCSYFTGSTEILALRDAYKKKMGNSYSLKDFHEAFLSYGTAPVKYIREAMLK